LAFSRGVSFLKYYDTLKVRRHTTRKYTIGLSLRVKIQQYRAIALSFKTKITEEKMKDAAVSVRNTRTKKHEVAKVKESIDHSLVDRPDNPNVSPEDRQENYYWVLGEEVPNNKDELKKASIKASKYIDKIINPNTKYQDENVNKRADEKCKINKWIEGKRANQSEIDVFNDVIDRIENRKPIENKLINRFEEIDDKISKRNDKINALKSLQKHHNIISKSEKKLSPMEVVTVEKLFKLTSRTDCTMDAKDNVQLMDDFHKEHFSEYPVIMKAGHYDEVKNHGHFIHSGRNEKTKKFDYPDAELKLVKNWMNKHGIECNYKDKSWTQMNEDDLKIHGENWQKLKIEYGNSWLEKNGYDDFKFKKLDEDEHLRMKEKFSKDPSVKKKITDREYNTSKYYENKSNEEKDKHEIYRDVSNNLEGNLNSKREESIKLDKEIIDKKGLLNKVKDEFNKFKDELNEFKSKVFGDSSDNKIESQAQKTVTSGRAVTNLLSDTKGSIDTTLTNAASQTSQGTCTECNINPAMYKTLCAGCYSQSDDYENDTAEAKAQKLKDSLSSNKVGQSIHYKPRPSGPK
jgi:hypothetical protein